MISGNQGLDARIIQQRTAVRQRLVEVVSSTLCVQTRLRMQVPKLRSCLVWPLQKGRNATSLDMPSSALTAASASIWSWSSPASLLCDTATLCTKVYTTLNSCRTVR